MLAAAKVFRPDLWKRYAKPQTALVGGITILAIAFWLITDRGLLAATGLLLVQPLAGAVGGFPLLALGFTLILAAALDLEHVMCRWRIPGAGTVAVISYSLYLTHKTVMHVDALLLGNEDLEELLGFLIYFVSSFIVAAIIWWCIERPFLNLRKRFSPDRPGQHAPGDRLPNNR